MLLVLLALPAAAQSLYREGIVVTTVGDTLKGFIEPWESDLSPTSVNFKTSLEGEAKRYSIDEVMYFSISRVVSYQRFTVMMSQEPVDLRKLADYINLPHVRKTVFMKVVQTGPLLSLYANSDELKIRYYIFHTGLEMPEELVYKIIMKGDYWVENFAFRDFLKHFSQRNGVLTKKLKHVIERTLYEESDLLEVVSVINGVKKEIIKVTEKEATGFTLGAGINMANLHYNRTDETARDELAKNAQYTPSLKYWVAVGYDMAKNPLVGTAVFRGELSYSEAELTTTTHNYLYSRNIDVTHYFKQHNVALGLSYLYHFYHKDKIKIYVGSGGRLNFSFYQYEYDYVLTVPGNPGSAQVLSNKDAEPRKLWFSIPIKAGIVFRKKFEIAAMYCLNSTLSHDDFNFKYGINFFQGGVVYHF